MKMAICKKKANSKIYLKISINNKFLVYRINFFFHINIYLYLYLV